LTVAELSIDFLFAFVNCRDGSEIKRKKDVEYIVMRYAAGAYLEGIVGVNIHIQ